MKTLIVIPSLGHGGTNKSLLNIIGEIGKEYDIKILSLSKDGVYKNTFSKYLLKYEKSFDLIKKHNQSRRNIAKYFISLVKKLYFKLFYKGDYKNVFIKTAKKYSGKYDIVIGFEEGIATEFASYITAEKHYAWVRCDYLNYLKLSNKTNEEDIYQKYDKIICVSKYTTSVFKEYYKNLENKVIHVYNVINYNEIINLSNEEIDDNKFKNNKFSIVSIGRLDAVKRFEYIPKIAKELKEKGLDFYWYILGDGYMKNTIANEIEKCGVSDSVKLLGAKSNPYPYVAKSDVVVCLSSSEACPNVINEGKILHKIIFSTDFPTAKEFIENRENGIIESIENIGDTIYAVLEDKELSLKIQNNINNFKQDNSNQIFSVSKLFKGEL